MKKLYNLFLLIKTIKNFHIVLSEYLFPQNEGFLKIYTRKNQTILCRKGTTDFHEVISVLSGREYPLHKLNISKKPTVINIGAHIGTTDLFIKQSFPEAKIFSFEPNPSNFILLNKNLEINKLNYVQTFKYGVSSKSGTSKLFFERCKPNEGNIFSGNNFTKVKVTTLNKILLNNNLDEIDLLKVDCEGCEYEIFDNLNKNLPIKYIALEYHEISSEKSFKVLNNKLSSFYKTIFHNYNKDLLSGILLLEKIYEK